MSFEILGHTKDLRSGADVIYCKSSIEKYLEIVGSDFQEFELQRKRENHKGYSRLKKDIADGALLPSITLAIKPHKVINVETLLENRETLKTFLSGKGNVDILDGLQRTYVIKELADESCNFKEGQELLLEYWFEKDIGKLIYRMIVLNSGQKAMSLRHQIELLFISLKETIVGEIKGIELIKENEGLRRTQSSRYILGDVASAYQAFMTVSTELDKSQIIGAGLGNTNILDSSEEELTKKFENFILYFKRFKEIDELAWDHYKSNTYKLSESDDEELAELKSIKKPTQDQNIRIVELSAYKNSHMWLGKDNVMMGLFCAISSYLGGKKENRVNVALDRLENSLRENENDPLGLLSYEKNKSDINPRKSNVGFATRKLILNGFKEYFRDDGNTPMNECWDLAVD
tara:strand:+ start:1110 stop:2321 length:1212 start_codon:yes stop_codon:yes gene_type:complete